MARHSTTRSTVDRRRSARAGVLACALLLAACASGQEWIYEKPRTTPAELARDKAACRKVAPSRSMWRTLERDKVERDAFNRCMAGRGYTITVVPAQ